MDMNEKKELSMRIGKDILYSEIAKSYISKHPCKNPWTDMSDKEFSSLADKIEKSPAFFLKYENALRDAFPDFEELKIK